MLDAVYAYDPQGLLQPANDVPSHWQVCNEWHAIPLENAALLICMEIPPVPIAHLRNWILVNDPLADYALHHQPTHARFCGWNSFWQRPLWEISTDQSRAISSEALQMLQALLGKQLTEVAAQSGLVAPRVVCSIINEAFYGLADNISSPADMDIAMKLGTNYPKGPWEWLEAIGADNVWALLQKMSESDARYTPHPLLVNRIAS